METAAPSTAAAGSGDGGDRLPGVAGVGDEALHAAVLLQLLLMVVPAGVRLWRCTGLRAFTTAPKHARTGARFWGCLLLAGTEAVGAGVETVSAGAGAGAVCVAGWLRTAAGAALATVVRFAAVRFAAARSARRAPAFLRAALCFRTATAAATAHTAAAAATGRTLVGDEVLVVWTLVVPCWFCCCCFGTSRAVSPCTRVECVDAPASMGVAVGVVLLLAPVVLELVLLWMKRNCGLGVDAGLLLLLLDASHQLLRMDDSGGGA